MGKAGTLPIIRRAIQSPWEDMLTGLLVSLPLVLQIYVVSFVLSFQYVRKLSRPESGARKGALPADEGMKNRPIKNCGGG